MTTYTNYRPVEAKYITGKHQTVDFVLVHPRPINSFFNHFGYILTLVKNHLYVLTFSNHLHSTYTGNYMPLYPTVSIRTDVADTALTYQTLALTRTPTPSSKPNQNRRLKTCINADPVTLKRLVSMFTHIGIIGLGPAWDMIVYRVNLREQNLLETYIQFS